MNNEIEDKHIVEKVNNVIELNAQNTDVGKEKLTVKTYTRIPKNTKVPEPAYQCETCHSNFTAYDDLRQHKLIFHKDPKDIQMPEVFELTSNEKMEMFEIPGIVNEAAIDISKNQDMIFETPTNKCETRNVPDAADFIPEIQDDVVQTTDGTSIESLNTVNATLGSVKVKKFKNHFTCSICENGIFRSRKTLNQHARKVHGLKNFGSGWGRLYSRGASHNSMIPTLKLVTVINNTQETLAKNKFPCDQCNFIFNSELGLKEHMQFHSYNPPKFKAKKRIKCNLCDKMCSNSVAFKNHLMSDHKMLPEKSSAKKLPCHICGSKLTSLKSYEHHMKMHDKEECVVRRKAPPKKKDPTYDGLCPICKVGYDTRLDYKNHFAIVHKDLPNHTRVAIKRGRSFFYDVCKYCMKQCYAKSQFVNHVKSHEKVPRMRKKQISGPGYRCDQCQAIFQKSHLLLRHKARHKKNNPILYCDQCSLTCPNVGSLRKHYLMAHDKSLPKSLDAFKVERYDQNDFNDHGQNDSDDQGQNEYEGQQQKYDQNLLLKLEAMRKEKQTLYCDQCSLTCPNVGSLRIHYLMAHDKSLPKSLEGFKRDKDDQNVYDDYDQTDSDHHGQIDSDDHGQNEYVDQYQNDYEDQYQNDYEDQYQSDYEYPQNNLKTNLYGNQHQNLQENDIQKANTLSFVDYKFNTENQGCETDSSFMLPNSEIPNIKIKIEPPDDPETSHSMADVPSENEMDFNEELIIPNYLDSD